jgi:hypothetical protein
MTLFRVNFSDKSVPVVRETEIVLERDRTKDLVGIVEAVYQAAKDGHSLEELKAWAVIFWEQRE